MPRGDALRQGLAEVLDRILRMEVPECGRDGERARTDPSDGMASGAVRPDEGLARRIWTSVAVATDPMRVRRSIDKARRMYKWRLRIKWGVGSDEGRRCHQGSRRTDDASRETSHIRQRTVAEPMTASPSIRKLSAKGRAVSGSAWLGRRRHWSTMRRACL